MNLELFFEPLSDEFMLSFQEDDNLFTSTKFFTSSSKPSIEDAAIIIVGIPECRGGIQNFDADQAPNAIRTHLYNLKSSREELTIVDLGDLRLGDEREDTVDRVAEVVRYLIEKDKFVILLGGTHDLDEAQFKAYQDIKPVSMVSIDSRFDMSEFFTPGQENLHHTRNILLMEPNNLLSFSNIGYQSYLISKKDQNTLEKLLCETVRLGKFRSNPEEVEPIIRASDMISFDVTAIKSEIAPGTNHPFPFGLTGEEACQIAWYAGNADHLSSFGIYEYNPKNDPTSQTAKIIATILWYLIDGFYNRKGNLDFESMEYMKYVVPMPLDPGELIFYKHRATEKWWMKVQYSSPGKAIQSVVIPCSYADFKQANDAEIPDRWILTNARHS